MKEREDCLLLLSDCVFPSIGQQPISGFVAIEGNRIAAVGPKSESGPWKKKANQLLDLGDRLVCPGFTDVHTFFSGWALLSLGADFSGVRSDVEGVAALKKYELEAPVGSALFGYGWKADHFKITDPNLLDRTWPDKPVVVFTPDRGNCWMNAAARRCYGFGPEKCYAEMTWKMIREYLQLPCMKDKYKEYMAMLNARGVTTIKEMTFDTYYGFADVIEQLEKEDALTLRISMMSQPVGEGINIEHAKAMRRRFQGPFVSFSGFNRMTDRSVPSSMAELIEPYKSHPGCTNTVPVEWELIERETHLADENGFRYSLHCQGDGAIRNTVDLFNSCLKDEQGRLKNRHAITDLEYSNPADLEKFGRMGGIAEVYAQIQSLDNKDDVLEMIDNQLGGDRGINYWNRRKMWDSGMVVSCGTDLPLLLPSVPESIWCGCGGHFADGGTYNPQNMLTITEMLSAWTRNGQYNCYNEDRLGTLEPGKLADITVLSGNVFRHSEEEIRNFKVDLTISDGRIVYEAL
ncbi:amidohydrolase [Caproiciproducens sp. R1]|uniref:amidohydrolase n=1 Tax=Caproiciproducens sp. R1 TaxID=3435000 RepID=UPI00403472B5